MRVKNSWYCEIADAQGSFKSEKGEHFGYPKTKKTKQNSVVLHEASYPWTAVLITGSAFKDGHLKQQVTFQSLIKLVND